MRGDTTKPASDATEEELFDNWFDPIETALRAKVRGFIETTIEEELDTIKSQLVQLSTFAPAITGTAWSGPRFFGLHAGP